VAGLPLGRCECGAVRYQVADGKQTRCGTCGSYLFSVVLTASTLQLLAWIAERQTCGYAETIEAWRSSCPRLTVWEDALADGLVRVERRRVLLTAAGAEALRRMDAP
jgi:hypothetical protein